MNSHNSTQIASNELECMMQLGELYSGGMKLDDAVKAVQHSAPACKTYLDDVGHFCKMYTGGASFPLLKCLDTFCTLQFLLVDFGLKFGLHQKLCHARGSLEIMHLSQISLGKKHGHSLLIGEEMMNHLAFYDFKIQGRSMALTRVALAAAMLSSQKNTKVGFQGWFTRVTLISSKARKPPEKWMECWVHFGIKWTNPILIGGTCAGALLQSGWFFTFFRKRKLPSRILLNLSSK